jgi:phospholipid/cholesterol/gamma-HCH transport system permease protein
LSAPSIPHGPDARATALYPLPQRAGIKIFRGVARAFFATFGDIGRRVLFTREIARAFGEPATYQTRYQLLPGVPLTTVGWIVRQMVILELGPLLTALVLTGRVGARMTAELGTMRVTEQIDALETLAYDPVAYLIIPRLLAALVMLPVLTVIANTVGILAGLVISTVAAGVPLADYTAGLRLTFGPFQVFYSLLKALLFGGAIAVTCTYEGFITGAGAEGVGRSTARSVVITSVTILALDALIALYLAKFLQ